MIPRTERKPEKDDLVELRFLEGVARRKPDDALVFKALGDLYTRIGNVEAGLQADLKLVRLCPRESEVWYNLGCSYALLEQADKAFEVLNKAVDLGYRDLVWMGQDDDLEAIRSDQRYERLMHRIMAGVPEDDPSSGGE